MNAPRDVRDDRGARRGSLAPPPGSSLAGALACLFALLAGGAGLALIGALPIQRIAVLSAPILLGGAAYPLLMRATPVEPSALKVLLFSVLGSPFVLLVVCAVARLFLSQREALGAAFLAVAFLQPLALGRPLKFDRLGAAAWGTLLFSLVLASYLAWLLFLPEGGARQLTPGALRHAGLAQGLLRPGALENPWLADTPARWVSAYHGLVALVSASLEVDVLRAQAGLAVGAAACLPIALYLLAAPLWQRSIPCLLAGPLALLGWNAASGLRGIAGPGSASPELWANRLSELTPGAQPGALPYGLSSFLAVGPEGLAMTLAVSAWTAGAHALRHGARPWPGLCALLHLAAIAVDPRLGVVAGLATLLAYAGLLLLPKRGAPLGRMGPAWLVILLGGFGLVRLLPAGSAQYPEAAPWDAFPGDVGVAVLWAGLPLLLLAGCGLLPAARASESSRIQGRGTVAWLVFMAVLMPALGAAHEFLGVGHPEHVARPAGDALRLASLPLGVLAAGGLAGLCSSGMGLRLVGAAVALALGFGGLRTGLHAHGAHRSLARLLGPLEEHGSSMDLRSVRAEDEALAEALIELRENPDLRHPGALLLCALDAALPQERGWPGVRYWPQLAGLVADLPIYVELDREVDFGSRHGLRRSEDLALALGQRTGVSPPFVQGLRELGRPVWILIREVDRQRTAIGEKGRPRGAELDMERLGASLEQQDEGLTRLLLGAPGGARIR